MISITGKPASCHQERHSDVAIIIIVGVVLLRLRCAGFKLLGLWLAEGARNTPET